MIPSEPLVKQSIIIRQRQPLHVHFADEVDNSKVKFISFDEAEGGREEDAMMRTTDDDDDIEKVVSKRLQQKHDQVQKQRQQQLSGQFSWGETSEESQSSGQYSFEDTSGQYTYSPSEDSIKSYVSLTLDEVFTIGRPGESVLGSSSSSSISISKRLVAD